MIFRNLVLNFFFFILINFLFFFQVFFSLNFFFFIIIDEELIICCAIFFVFILFINQIVSGLQDMLKARIDIYLNVFLMVFRLLKKILKRFKRHNFKILNVRNSIAISLVQIFLKNLASFSNYQNSLNFYMIHLRFKTIVDFVLSDIELRMLLRKEILRSAYLKELKYFQLIENLS